MLNVWKHCVSRQMLIFTMFSLSVSLQELHIIRTQPVVLKSLSSPPQRSESSLSPQDESSASVSPTDYLLDINKVLLAMADNELLLNSSELSGGLFEDFSSQEDTLRVRHTLICLDTTVSFMTGFKKAKYQYTSTSIGELLWNRLAKLQLLDIITSCSLAVSIDFSVSLFLEYKGEFGAVGWAGWSD